MVHVVLFPLSSTTTLVAAAMFESETACSAPLYSGDISYYEKFSKQY